MSKKPPKHSIASVKKALKTTYGNVTKACAVLGISPNQFYDQYYPELKPELTTYREARQQVVIDLAVDTLILALTPTNLKMGGELPLSLKQRADIALRFLERMNGKGLWVGQDGGENPQDYLQIKFIDRYQELIPDND